MPLVLLNKMRRQHGSPQTSFIQFGQLRDKSLAERGNSNHIVTGSRHIKDAKFDGTEKWMWANIPPDAFPVVDTPSFDQSLHVGVKIAPGWENLWYSAAWEGLPHRGTIGFEAGEAPSPER